MLWSPVLPKFKIIAECDSYQFHDNREKFDRDRARSRALQKRGFKVLQYSGGEITRKPVDISLSFYMDVLEEFDRVSKDALPPLIME